MPYSDPDKRRECEKASIKRWREKNKEAHQEYKRGWNLRNRVRINERRRERYANDVEYRLRVENSIRANRWDVSPEEMAAFLAMYEEDCFYCGNEGGTVDHLTPRSRGGEDRLHNLVPCCKPCNSSKNNKTPEEWYDAAGFAIR